jgi:hypothetical protein
MFLVLERLREFEEGRDCSALTPDELRELLELIEPTTIQDLTDEPDDALMHHVLNALFDRLYVVSPTLEEIDHMHRVTPDSGSREDIDILKNRKTESDL